MTTRGLEEIARLAGVSRSTVSRVVNDHPSVRPAVRERIQRIIAETGFQPNAAARSLASQRSYMLGLVIPRTVHTVFTDPYFPHLTQGVAQACNDHDYTLSLFIENDDSKLFPRLSRAGLMDGVVVQASSVDDGLIPKLQATGLPLVVAGRPSQVEGVSYVDVDNIKGTYSAVSHLVSLGHTRIATITGPLNSSVGADRLAGYRQAMDAQGVPMDVALMVSGDFTEQSGYLAARRLLALKPTALFAASDVMARGAVRALNEAGLNVPRDVAVVGFDDLPPATVTHPLLTTVRQPIRRMGARAIQTLLDVIANGAEPPRRFVFETELIIRESCGAALAQGEPSVFNRPGPSEA
jgi:LacI family transcriptional regulator